MPDRPTIFTSKDDFVRGNEERQSIFGRGTVRQGLPPASREEIRADKASRVIPPPEGSSSAAIPFGPASQGETRVIEEIFRQVEPQQGSYINSQEFRQMFLKFAYGSEDLSDEEKRQISIAMDLYPPLRQVAQTIANTPRPEATIGAITNEQAEEGLRSYEKMMAEEGAVLLRHYSESATL
ncbi:MAG: hypothetical protein IIB58_03825 [Planctomycetes bacterium]|nr:hypothetical protein [Planctomycetota bacterium]